MSLRRFLRRSRWDEERAREIEGYIEIETDDNIARGMTPVEARAAARRKFGNSAVVREEIYRMNTIGFLETLLKDIRYAARALRQSPGFAAVAILSLALGIGANTALFSLVNTLMLRRLPVPDADQLVQLAMVSTGPNGQKKAPDAVFNYPLFEQLRDHNDVFSGMTATINPDRGGILIDGHEEAAELHIVTGTYFSTLGVQPVLGRSFTGAQDKPGAERVAVMSYAYWQRRFALDPQVLGKQFTRRKLVFTVIGVAPKGFTGVEIGANADFWLPMVTTTPRTTAFFGPAAHGLWTFRILARSKPGLSRKQVLAGAGVTFSQVLEAEDRVNRSRNPGGAAPEVELRRFTQRKLVLLDAGSGLSYLRAQYAQPLFILMGVVGLVLLIACANIGNLLMARATARRREIAVRLAIGAGPGRLFRQLLTESLLLAVLGAAAGLIFAFWAGNTLIAMVLGATQSNIHFQIDMRVLGFLAGVALATGCLFGVGPSWRATRVDVNPALKNETVTERARHGFRVPAGPALVVCQVALSLVLLVGAVLFIGTVRKLLTQDIGFQRDAVVLVRFLAPPNLHTADLLPVYDRLLERVKGLPGVRAAALSDNAPFDGGTISYHFHAQGRAAEQGRSVDLQVVSPGYFDTMGSAVLQGRPFSARDDGSAAKVAIVNEALVRQFFPGEAAIGKRFGWDPASSSEREIVGVVKDAKWSSLREAAPAFVYLPVAQPKDDLGGGGSLSVRVAGNPDGVIPAIRREVQEAHVFSNLRIDTQAALVESTLGQELLLAKLSGFFGGLGLLLAAVGLFGVMSYTVSRRTREFGLRVALGARPADLLRSVMLQTATLVGIGLAAGALTALAAGRLVKDFLFQIAPNDPAVTAIAAVLLAAVAMLAAWLPARRASRVDPMVALRQE